MRFTELLNGFYFRLQSRELNGEFNLDPLWITCDPENIASRRTLELAGAKFVEIVDVPENCIIHRNGHPRKCRYRLSLTQ